MVYSCIYVYKDQSWQYAMHQKQQRLYHLNKNYIQHTPLGGKSKRQRLSKRHSSVTFVVPGTVFLNWLPNRIDPILTVFKIQLCNCISVIYIWRCSFTDFISISGSSLDTQHWVGMLSSGNTTASFCIREWTRLPRNRDSIRSME